AVNIFTDGGYDDLLNEDAAFNLYTDLRFNKERLDMAHRAENAAHNKNLSLQKLISKLLKQTGAEGCKFIICLPEDHVMSSSGTMQEPLPLTICSLHRLFKGEVVSCEDLYCQPVYIERHLIG